MTTVDAFLTNCRIADGRLVDIGIAGGKIALVGEGAAPPDGKIVARDGAFLAAPIRVASDAVA